MSDCCSRCGSRICLAAQSPTSDALAPPATRALRIVSPPSLDATGAGLSTCSPSPTLHWLSQQPRLRSRLTLGRLPWPRNPQASGVAGSHCHARYSFRHSRFRPLQASSRSPFAAERNAPLPRLWAPVGAPAAHREQPPPQTSAASVGRLSPAVLSAQGHSTSELLRTLSRMAASKPTSWLSERPHHLAHSAATWGP